MINILIQNLNENIINKSADEIEFGFFETTLVYEL